MKLSYIYKITNTVNNKKYIGFTSRKPQQRWMEHVSRSRYDKKYSSAIHSTLRKYGVDTFTFEVIYVSWDRDYCVKIIEPLLIKEYDTYNNGYNLSSGGELIEVNAIVGAKISKSKMGHSVSKQTRDKLSEFNRRTYLIKFPSGSEQIIDNLKEFCKQNNISYTYALKVANKKRKHITGCKGINITKMDTHNRVQGGSLLR